MAKKSHAQDKRTDGGHMIDRQNEGMPPEGRILMALMLVPSVLEERPLYMLLWTGDLERFGKGRPHIVALAVENSERMIPVSDLIPGVRALWDLQPAVYTGRVHVKNASWLLGKMGEAGGKLDYQERFLSAEVVDRIKSAQAEANLNFVIDLLGTKKFNDGGQLRIVWLMRNGAFYGGDVPASIARTLLPACEEFYTKETFRR